MVQDNDMGYMVGGIQLKWDAKDLEIKTRSVEMALQPLVMKVRQKSSNIG